MGRSHAERHCAPRTVAPTLHAPSPCRMLWGGPRSRWRWRCQDETPYSRPRSAVQPRGARSVDRARLRALLDGAPEARLVLVSAPAGFGKSTLLADVARAGRRPQRVAVARPARRGHRPLHAVSRGGGRAGWRAGATNLWSLTLPGRSMPSWPWRASSTTSSMPLADGPASGVVLVLDDYHVIGEPRHPSARRLPHRAPAPACPAGHRDARPIRPCRSRACAPGASSWRSGPRTCASRRTKPTSCCDPRRSSSRRAMSPSSPSGPRAGRRRCGWPPSRSAADLTRPSSCAGSEPVTASSSTTSSRRSSPDCRPRPRSSCCAPRSSIACAVRSATPSRASRMARRGSRSSSAPTCSSSRSTTSALVPVSRAVRGGPPCAAGHAPCGRRPGPSRPGGGVARGSGRRRRGHQPRAPVGRSRRTPACSWRKPRCATSTPAS